MRVLHVAQTTAGGAGRGLLGLHSGLLTRGVDSRVLALDGPWPSPTVSRLNGMLESRTRGALWLSKALRRLGGGKTCGTLHTPLVPTAVPAAIQRFEPDVVHLHWLGNLLTPPQIGRLATECPVVWTLRDMAPFTGGCHYDGGCGRFESRCGRCPLLERGSPRDPTFWVHRSRRRTSERVSLTLVALSQWLADEARRSPALPAGRIEIVPPGIDTRVFHPRDRASARRTFGLGQHVPVVGFVAVRPGEDPRKGLDMLVAAVADLITTYPDVVVVTTASSETGQLPLAPHALEVGHIDDDDRLAQLYSACDVVVVPSRQEAFGKVAVEAMACGTPVVAFNGTGLASAITHKTTGYLARHGDVPDLAAGIRWGMRHRNESRPFPWHREVAHHFSLERQAARYDEIYASVVRCRL